MSKVGLYPENLRELLHRLGYWQAFGALTQELIRIAESPVMIELISTLDLDPKIEQGPRQFLDWYRQFDPARSQAFLSALSMQGVKKQDFWRLSADRTRWYEATAEYQAELRRASSARRDYLTRALASLPSKQEFQSRPSGKRAPDKGGACLGVVNGRSI
jgi:hypothetical protein